MTRKKGRILLLPLILLLSILMVSASGCAKPAAVPANKQFVFNEDDWIPVYIDNFDSGTLNPDIWQLDPMKARRGAWNAGGKENVFFRDGNLVLRAEYRDGDRGKGWYTPFLTTRANKETGEGGLYAAQGYYEIRCKVPKSIGIWAAFWSLSDEGMSAKNEVGTGADGAEIDIMESLYVKRRGDNEVMTHALHIDGFGKNLKSKTSPLFHVDNLYDEFHTYGLEWTEDEYIFYIDGQETWRTTDKYGTVSSVKQHLILSLEVGGYIKDGTPIPGKEKYGIIVRSAYWGNPMKNDLTKPYDYEIDYIKVYQRK